MAAPERIFGFDLTPVPASTAALPLTDLTIRRGYGAFDFLRVEENVPLFLDDHLDRLERSADLLGLAPRPTPDALRAHVLDVIAANEERSFGMQLFLTGGDPDDGFAPGRPRTLVLIVDLPSYPEAAYRDGVRLLEHRFERDLPAAKTTNYFTAVRHARALREAGATDLLYHDGHRALETTRCNLFVLGDDGRWATPGEGILPGVTRLHVLATLGEDAAVRDVPLDELYGAREAFLTSTTKGVMPVVEVGGRRIGEGRPGPRTREVAEAFERHRDAWRAGFAAAPVVGRS
jgi:branched-subunit amino acid aminotransferase/4-amino-4-deoxychorismate lyase